MPTPDCPVKPPYMALKKKKKVPENTWELKAQAFNLWQSSPLTSPSIWHLQSRASAGDRTDVVNVCICKSAVGKELLQEVCADKTSCPT